MTGAALHLVTEDEAQTLELRARAVSIFASRYLHNTESQRAMLGSLRRLAGVFSNHTMNEHTFPWEVLVDEDLSFLMWSTVAENYAHATGAKDATALRRIISCCHRVGLLTYEEYRHAISFEAKGGIHRPPAGHYLSEDDVELILITCATGTGGHNTRIRDTALVMALASTGARGNEITGVGTKETHLAERRLWLSRTKSGNPRNAWLHPASVPPLEDWLRVRGPEPGALFVPLSRTGRPLHSHGALSTHQAWKIVRARASEAGFAGITPHDLRRFAITTLLDHGVDIALVAKTVGHTKTTTTARYDRRPAVRQREAVATIRFPAIPRPSR